MFIEGMKCRNRQATIERMSDGRYRVKPQVWDGTKWQTIGPKNYKTLGQARRRVNAEIKTWRGKPEKITVSFPDEITVSSYGKTSKVYSL